ncbi:MAG: type I pantothenate kinase [Alphaproteobacteria bacterium]|nr:type I pantothenate kinase [Alphaproteobacteria bacterium]
MAFQQHPRAVLTRLSQQIPQTVLKAALQKEALSSPESTADEFSGVYLPLSLLLQRRFKALKEVRAQTSAAFGAPPVNTPFIIGLAGSVAVGKSTCARMLQAALSSWPENQRVALVTSDGFLFPNATLKQRGLMERKGFPESFDAEGLVDFLRRVKSGEKGMMAPVYSHDIYDILPERGTLIDAPDVLIVEGINVLQPHLSQGARDHLIASDYFDYSIYLHADETMIKKWYTERFLALTEAALNNPGSFYSRFVPMTPEQRLEVVDNVWTAINGRNLNDHILPTRMRADLILHKDADHRVTQFETRLR